MEEYRCKSYSDGRMEIERCSSTSSYSGNNKHTSETSSNSNNNGVVFEHIRSYSTSSSYAATSVQQPPKELRKDKRVNGSFSKAAWCFGDPEMQRKKRVAGYKSYNVQGKLKRSFTKSFRWIKHTYSNMVHGS
ncbi:uncharacterized protein LOC141640381 [Silene latifolia]|uniref:uncharacterized protein LOC141640381 n=1 Tax=Silene latifolia TaxID=37657 RepID=UPI003D77C481